jgi:type IV pilus assembly protein PilP
MKKLLFLTCCAFLVACSGEGSHGDLSQWMNDASRNLKGKVSPLPQVKPYKPVAYDIEDLADPFNASRVIPERVRSSGSGVQGPDRDRPREPLEAYPLESLKYVGVITTQEQESTAIIRVDSALYQVRPGNYLGQNFGVITGITESEVVLKELVQDAVGDWVERVSSLLLQGQEVMK